MKIPDLMSLSKCLRRNLGPILNSRVYTLENPTPPWGENISQCHLGEKMCKVEEKKRENVKEKERGKKKRKGEVKG